MQVMRKKIGNDPSPLEGAMFHPNVGTVGQRPNADDATWAARDIRAITCFTPGTGIATQTGLKVVETLKIGDRVLTRDCGFQPVRWVGQRHVSCSKFPANPNSLPVLIRADALGPGKPERDIIVSPRHRVLTQECKHLSETGETEALIEAGALVGQPGIMCVVPHELTYIHVLFDHHEVILSDNMWSESFHLSTPTIAALLKDQNTAIQDIFPQIKTKPQSSPQELARLCLSREQMLAAYA